MTKTAESISLFVLGIADKLLKILLKFAKTV